MSRGSSEKKASKRSSRNGSMGGNCHRTGPSFCPSSNTPEAKKFASGASICVSLRMCVM